VAKEVMAIMSGNRTGLSIIKLLEALFAGKHPKPIEKGTKAAAAEAAVTAAEATAVADLEVTKRLAAEFEAKGGGALAMALAQEAESSGPLRECWLACERLRVSEARSINLPEFLAARTGVAAEAAEVAAAEDAFAEDAAATEAGAAVEAAAALAAELPKGPDGGTGGMAEDAEENPGRPVFSVGAREELKTRGGSLRSEGAKAAVQAEKSTPIKVLRSLAYSNALILNAITT
jgi:hypothetical protein